EESDQLGLYARALKANGLIADGTPVTLTYLFLDGGAPAARAWNP
ncbi:MAG: hypothetical protein H0W06_01210, partial [Chloroflexia bacterium]|nr:hypothetical protein [Chloroflexia bacterium]